MASLSSPRASSLWSLLWTTLLAADILGSSSCSSNVIVTSAFLIQHHHQGRRCYYSCSWPSHYDCRQAFIDRPKLLSSTTALAATSSSTSEEADVDDDDEDDIDARLLEIAKRLKLEIFDLDEGIYGFDSQDSQYGLEVVRTSIPLSAENTNNGGLGLVLTEMAGNDDGRGLVLVRHVSGNAVRAQPSSIQVGDVITGVFAASLQERTTGLNYDRTVEAIGRVKEAVMTGGDNRNDGVSWITLELNRLVKRAEIQVEVVESSGQVGTKTTTTTKPKVVTTIQALAGENLRRLLLRKNISLYDRETKRFDMPYAKGDCAGEGLCGTCLVAVQQGNDLLNPQDNVEQLMTRGRPLSWRASCRVVVGANNQGGTIRIITKPQSGYADEIDPGVRSLSTE